ncbi:hypothetical protein Tco_1487225 [Tanacetum coccineum]
MKNDPESQVDDFDLWDALKDKFQKSLPPLNTCRPEASQKRDHDDHLDDHLKGETGSKRQKTTKGSSSANVTSSLKTTTVAYADMMRSQCKTGAEYKYHIWKMLNYLNNHIMLESRDQDLTPQVLEKIALVYQGSMKTEADEVGLRYHCINDFMLPFFGKTIWKKCLQDGKTRSDPDEVFSNKKIVEIIRVLHHDAYGQDLIDEVCVKRSDDKAYLFSKSDFKYLNKNDIEDMYYICMRRRNNPQQTALIKALIVFIKICVIWERVHDCHLGIESYQIKVNLTAPTITFPGIETLPLYSIIADPFVGIVYENNKKEKRAMNIDELQKFSDATLKRVLKKISAINVEARHGFKDPPLNEKDKELMVLFEEEIEERLKYRRQMRRWESFVNGRPIQ